MARFGRSYVNLIWKTRGVAKKQILAVDAGSYTLTGTAASTLHQWKVGAGAGSYALTGTAATPKRGQVTAAGAGSYTLTGTAATLLHAWKPSAGTGSYSLTGTAAATLHGWKVGAGAGSYTLTGTSVALRTSTIAGAGSYALTGTAATLRHAWKLSAGAGAYALTGTDASLVLTGAGSLTLTANAGSYALSGVAAPLLHGWVLFAEAAGGGGAFQESAFQESAFQTSSTGYLLTGSDATLTKGGQAEPTTTIVEVVWPRTHLRRGGRKREEPDYSLLRELIRNRNEAIAEYQRRNETTEEPEVRVEIPRGVSPEVQRALREFLAPYNITPFNPPIGLVTELALIEAQRLEMELRLLEEEELAIVLALAA